MAARAAEIVAGMSPVRPVWGSLVWDFWHCFTLLFAHPGQMTGKIFKCTFGPHEMRGARGFGLGRFRAPEGAKTYPVMIARWSLPGDGKDRRAGRGEGWRRTSPGTRGVRRAVLPGDKRVGRQMLRGAGTYPGMLSRG
jgi:hypothetical protein